MHDTLDANLANLRRAKHAANALLVLLRRDLRVQQAHDVWRVAVAARRFEDAVDHARRLVRDDLGLSNYSWLSILLLRDFAVWPATVSLEPDAPADWPPGKEKGGAELMARDVEWFYRIKIKHPKDSERSVAREYLATLAGKRGGDGRATVRAAVTRAERALAALDLDDDPPLPK
jgi:hypothetical protein